MFLDACIIQVFGYSVISINSGFRVVYYWCIDFLEGYPYFIVM